MRWRCPACRTLIRHSDLEEKPRKGGLYRCHICRLELTLDPRTDRLMVTPLEAATDSVPKKPRRRTRG